MRMRNLPRLLCIAAALPLAACRDSTGSGAGDIPAPVPAYGAGVVATFNCTARPSAGTVACAEARATPAGGGASLAVFGATAVKLRSSNVRYDSASAIFGFDVTLQNLLAEPIGTGDGVTVTGSKVFYDQGPSVASYVSPGDTGSVVVANADGRARFTRADQPYHFYPQILAPGEISAQKRWELRMPPTVSTFAFVLKVFTATQSEPKVPEAAPDGVPEELYAAANVVENLPAMSGRYLRDVVTVLFEPDATLDERQAALDQVGGTVVGGLRFDVGGGLYYVRVPADSTGQPLVNALDRLNALPQVAGASPEFIDDESSEDFSRPLDGPLYRAWRLDPDQVQSATSTWGLEAISAPAAWGCETGSAGTPIAIVDSNFIPGVSADLSANLARHHKASRTHMGDGSHGNIVASVAAARGNNGTQMTGVMWRAELHMVEAATNAFGFPTLDAKGHPQIRGRSSKIGYAMSSTPARVINVSGGMSLSSALQVRIQNGTASQADATMAREYARGLRRFIRVMRVFGRRPLLVFSAGNDGLDATWNGYPNLVAEFPDQVIAVANARFAGAGNGYQGGIFARAHDSNFGALVHIAAPGDLVGAITGLGTVAQRGGTSAAAPMVAGAAGLLYSFDPRLTAAEVRALLVQGAVQGGRSIDNGPAGSVPVLNVHESLKLAAGRPGAPLCGNRVWAENGKVWALRGGTPEALFSVPGQVWELNPVHGGKRITVYTSEWEYRVYEWSNGSWSHVSTPPDPAVAPTPESSGAVNSWLGYSHGADSLAEISGHWPNTTQARYDIYVRELATRTSQLVNSVYVNHSIPPVTRYCSHEFVGAEPEPTDTAQKSAYARWVTEQAFGPDKCAYEGEVRSNWLAADGDWIAYSPRGDTALMVVNFSRVTERNSAPFDCVDRMKLATAAGDSFVVAVKFICRDRSGEDRAEGRQLYMVPLAGGASRVLTLPSDPSRHITAIGLSEDGKEVVARYEGKDFTWREKWEYLSFREIWALIPYTSDPRPCLIRYHDMATGAVVHSAPCTEPGYYFPATISASRSMVRGEPLARGEARPGPAPRPTQAELRDRRRGAAPAPRPPRPGRPTPALPDRHAH